MAEHSLIVVILAAGGSTRLGRPKQLLQVAGTTLIRKTSELALGLEVPVVVVLGAHEKLIRRQIQDLPLHMAMNPQWKLGMSSSLETGINCARQISPGLSGVLVLLVDQPLVHLDHLKKLINVARGESQAMVVTGYGQGRGVPAYIGSEHFEDIRTTSGDQGARALFAQKGKFIREVSLIDAAMDIDTEEDWQNYLNSQIGH